MHVAKHLQVFILWSIKNEKESQMWNNYKWIVHSANIKKRASLKKKYGFREAEGIQCTYKSFYNYWSKYLFQNVNITWSFGGELQSMIDNDVVSTKRRNNQWSQKRVISHVKRWMLQFKQVRWSLRFLFFISPPSYWCEFKLE